MSNFSAPDRANELKFPVNAFLEAKHDDIQYFQIFSNIREFWETSELILRPTIKNLFITIIVAILRSERVDQDSV